MRTSARPGCHRRAVIGNREERARGRHLTTRSSTARCGTTSGLPPMSALGRRVGWRTVRSRARARVPKVPRPVCASRGSRPQQVSHCRRMSSRGGHAALSGGRRVTNQLGEYIGETVDCCVEASRIERQRRFVLGDPEASLGDDPARVDRIGHPVPGDPVFRMPAKDRPGRRVESPHLGERSVVKIDTADARAMQNAGGNDRQVSDAEEKIVAQCGVSFQFSHCRHAAQLTTLRPRGDLRRFAHYRRDRMPRVEQRASAMHQQRFTSDQHV